MRLLLSAVSVLTFLLLPALPATAQSSSGEGQGVGIMLLDVPADAQTDPRARSYIVDHVAPGAKVERRVRVKNSTDEQQSVHIYPSAARVTGESFLGEEGATANELTTWMSSEKDYVDLAPGEAADVLITIDVPEAAPEGEQYAAIWAEVRSAASAGQNVVSASRAGVRVYLSVGPGNGPPADFTVDTLTAARDADGNPQVVATVRNTGGRALDITGSLILSSGPGGLSAGPIATEKTTTVVPGDTASVRSKLSAELPAGPWDATLTLTSGLISHEVSAEITFPDTGQTAAVPLETGGFPWLALVIGTAGMLVLAALLVLIQRRRPSHTPTAGNHDV